MDLERMRDKLDDIDARLVALFAERMETVRAVAEHKARAGLRIFDGERERVVINRAAERAGGDLERYARQLYQTLLEASRSYQRALIGATRPLAERLEAACALAASSGALARGPVACQGTEGSYAQQACDALFPTANIVYFERFDSVMDAVEKGLCRWGLLPIENSLAGSVTQVYDLMAQREFFIVRAMCRRIDHALLALPGTTLSGLDQVLSHPQALAQCSGFFKKNPRLAAVPWLNTATAAKHVAEAKQPSLAAIASKACAPLYGLEILDDAMADHALNHTRFVLIGKALEIRPDANRIGIAVVLLHRPGALQRLMAKFTALDINLVKLESRPIADRPFEFRFYIDMEASPHDPEVQALLCEIEESCERFQLLGAWREE